MIKLATAWVLRLQVGCATILSGATQNVEIDSEPQGATVTVYPEDLVITTPATVDLSRKDVHTLVFQLEGYETSNGYLDRISNTVAIFNFLGGGLLGLAVDMSSGAAYQLTPDPIFVDLVPVADVLDQHFETEVEN